jgi:Spy/CpxP family protein refolding chaperone
MRINQWLAMAGMAAVMCLGVSQVVAQPNNGGGRGAGGAGGGGRGGRGNFDPAQFRQRMMDNLKQTLEVTNDDEWKAIEPRIQKIMDLRRESFSGMGRGMFGRGPRGGDNAQPSDQGQSRRGGFGSSTPNPERDALQKAIDSKAAKAELKAALDKYTASRKAKQAEMEKAQAALRELLTPRQEAIATLDGLL